MKQYEQLSGTTVEVDRIMAWHVRTVLGDALWRAEAGVALPDGRTPAQWVDDLDARFAVLGTFGQGASVFGPPAGQIPEAGHVSGSAAAGSDF
ncbi:hypothetical protein [Actinoplanes sp. M2I2]|uniref:hypothetical protein n=1 Tax=Actinoplanes sp. M2I2 TaxID=1734444 RepID=UPI002020FEFE|nr:hypothetical protein [Actinoplanes sp. M2I2]